jgi:hypothetical protein
LLTSVNLVLMVTLGYNSLSPQAREVTRARRVIAVAEMRPGSCRGPGRRALRPLLKRELGEVLSLVSCDASSASVHLNHAPTPTSPDPAPLRASTAPASAPNTAVPTIVPTPARPPSGCVGVPGGCAGKTQTHASRDSRTAPTPTTSAPTGGAPTGSTPTRSTPTSSAPTSTAPPASRKPDAMNAAAPEPGTRRDVGGNERQAQSCDGQSSQCFPQHENLPSLRRHRQNR